ncbi:MAG: hypothetical protein P8Z70_07525, partial [Desulfuromonadales bacterium]
VFIPLAVYAIWCSFAMWPLLGMIPRETLGVTAAFGQVFIGGVAVITLRHFYGGTLLPEDHFRRPLFGWRNTLVFSGVNLLLLPLLLVYSFMATAGCFLDQKTAGFMRLSPTGIYTSERSYHHDGKTVLLVAMMHVARKGYYQELFHSLPAKRTIILAEGVTDRDRLLKGRFNYGRLANLVGLNSQETMHLDGNPVELNDLEQSGRTERPGAAGWAQAGSDQAGYRPCRCRRRSIQPPDRRVSQCSRSYGPWQKAVGAGSRGI